MKHEDLDRILSQEREITPSPGFVTSVMDAARQEAATPPPIPFPWRRAMPGVVAAVLALGFVLVAGMTSLARSPAAETPPVILPSALALTFELARAMGAGWIALALILSFASMKLSALLAAARG